MAVADFLLPADAAALTNPGARNVVEVPETAADIAVGASQFSQELAAAVVSVVLTSSATVLPTEPVLLPWNPTTRVAPPAVDIPAPQIEVGSESVGDALRPAATQPETSIFAQILAEARRIATTQAAHPQPSTPEPDGLPARLQPRMEPSTRLLAALGRPLLTETADPVEPAEEPVAELVDPAQRVPLLMAEISRLLSCATPQPTPVEPSQTRVVTTTDPSLTVPVSPTSQSDGKTPVPSTEPHHEQPGHQPATFGPVHIEPVDSTAASGPVQELTPPAMSTRSSKRGSLPERTTPRDGVKLSAAEEPANSPGVATSAQQTLLPTLAAVVPQRLETPLPPVEATLPQQSERVAKSGALPAAAAGEVPADERREQSASKGMANLLATSERGPLAEGGVDGVGEPTLSPRDPEAFAERLSRFVLRASERNEELQVRITPPDLGTIVIQVRSQADGLSIRLEASSEASQQLLTDHLPLLHESLAQLGRTAERIDVVRTETSPQFSSGGMGWSQQGSQEYRQPPELRPVRLAERPADAATTSPPTVVSAPGLDRLLELNIQI